MAVLLNKKDMATSLGISVQAFDKWGVIPTEKRGREVFYDVRSVLENRLAHQVRKQQPDEDSEVAVEQRLQIARVRLTEAQAEAQELKNQKGKGLVVETAFCTFALSRVAGEIAGILDGIPLTLQRRFPGVDPRHLDYLKSTLAKAMNRTAVVGERVEAWMDEYIEQSAD